MGRNEMELLVIVNGQPATLKANPNAPLHSLIGRALAQTGNAAGQPPENWEFRDVAGAVLPGERKIGDFNFPDGARLFLNLRAGVGGGG